jgi:hypothetical protein
MDAQRTPPPGHDPRRRALLGLIVAVLLVLLGLILVRVLRQSGRLEDCAMQGRTNCAPIDSSQ